MAIKPQPIDENRPFADRGRVPVSPPRRVAIVAVPPVRTLDVFGPAEVFADANHLNHGGLAYDVQIVSATEDRTVRSYFGVPFVADRTYREMRQPVDTLLVAGGEGAQEMKYSPKFLEWLRRQSGKARRYGSVCTGALVLAEAGLLDGHRVTTHWNWCRELEQKHPNVKVDPRPIYIRDKNLFTSAGVTAGIDLSLALVEDDLDGALALQIAQMYGRFSAASGRPVAVQRNFDGSSPRRSKSSRSFGLGGGQPSNETLCQQSRASSSDESPQFCPHIPGGNRRNPRSVYRHPAGGGGSPSTRNDRLVTRRSG
jgi:transcriptional regulator GlxA family with amidase domain